jgi:multicomponent Na+:H+ antiporter subunit E
VIRRWIAAAVGLGVLWVFVRGAAATPAAVLGQFLLGLAVGTPIAYVFRRLYSEGIDLTRTVAAVPSVVGFVLVFLREVVIANFDVAYRVLAPGDRLQPEVILVPLRVETDLGITTIANSITITPGTLTLDHDPEGNALYVHVIDGRDPHAIVDPMAWGSRPSWIRSAPGRTTHWGSSRSHARPATRHRRSRCTRPASTSRPSPTRRRGPPGAGRPTTREVATVRSEGALSTAVGADLVTTAADVGLVLVGVLCLLCGYRVIVGPTVPDRVVALDAIATNVVAIAVLFALKTGRGLFVTVSLVLAIIGFLSTVAVAKYVTEGDVIERREFDRVTAPTSEAEDAAEGADWAADGDSSTEEPSDGGPGSTADAGGVE